jgi:hypothetical protein
LTLVHLTITHASRNSSGKGCIIDAAPITVITIIFQRELLPLESSLEEEEEATGKAAAAAAGKQMAEPDEGGSLPIEAGN